MGVGSHGESRWPEGLKPVRGREWQTRGGWPAQAGEGGEQCSMRESFRENPDATVLRGGPPAQPPPGDIRKKQLLLDIPSLLQSLQAAHHPVEVTQSLELRGGGEGAVGKGAVGRRALGALRHGGPREPGLCWGPLTILAPLAQRLRMSGAEGTSEAMLPDPFHRA